MDNKIKLTLGAALIGALLLLAGCGTSAEDAKRAESVAVARAELNNLAEKRLGFSPDDESVDEYCEVILLNFGVDNPKAGPIVYPDGLRHRVTAQALVALLADTVAYEKSRAISEAQALWRSEANVEAAGIEAERAVMDGAVNFCQWQ